MSRPVLLATFANDRYGPTTGYLRDLVGERRAIEAALDRGPVEVVVRGNVTLDELFDLFSRYGERLAAWHHGGHAEADALFLETTAGTPTAARIEGLAARIGQLGRLRLLVLNGCTTGPQVETLRDHTPAAIVATDRAIVDAAARDFAERLYRDLAAGRTTAEAFASAASRVESAVEGPSRLLRPGATVATARPWRLHAHPDHPEAADWRLTDAPAPGARRLWLLAGLVAALLLAGVALWPDGRDAGPSCTPGREACDGADDDCDAIIDEGAACTAFGTGAVWGEARCVEGACQMASCPAGWHDIDGMYGTGCEYACDPIGEESCNAIDDDCDGTVDEGFAGCDLRCDGIDDDGDGRSDEGCPLTRCGPERAGHDPVPPCNGCPDGIEVPAGWVCIPPGEAELGSPPRRVDIERPFLMMSTELTRGRWAEIARRANAGARPSFDHCAAESDDLCPVDRVSWLDSVWFANALSGTAGLDPCYPPTLLAGCVGDPGGGCPPDRFTCVARYGRRGPRDVFTCSRAASERLRDIDFECTGYRLPTADEWEYAARAGESGRAPTALAEMAWSARTAGLRTRPVGGRAANTWGLHDMLGNVAEPVHGPRYEHRGGDIRIEPDRLEFATTGSEDRTYRMHRWGLRLVRDLPGGG